MPCVDDGEMAEAAMDHQHGGVLGGVVGLDRLRAARHPVADRRLRGEPAGDGAEDVALGEHADEPVVGEHEHGADAALVHLPDGVGEQRFRLDGEQVPAIRSATAACWAV